MYRHAADRSGQVMKRHPLELSKTRIGAVMIQKASTSPSHTRIRVGEAPEHGSDSCLACAN